MHSNSSTLWFYLPQSASQIHIVNHVSNQGEKGGMWRKRSACLFLLKAQRKLHKSLFPLISCQYNVVKEIGYNTAAGETENIARGCGFTQLTTFRAFITRKMVEGILEIVQSSKNFCKKNCFTSQRRKKYCTTGIITSKLNQQTYKKNSCQNIM